VAAQPDVVRQGVADRERRRFGDDPQVALGIEVAVVDRRRDALFGDRAGRDRQSLAISGTKSMTGHLMGAGGGIEAIATIQSIKTGIVPPTINQEHPDPECDLDYVPNEAREVEVTVGMSNSFGFGGHNATLAFRRYDA